MKDIQAAPGEGENHSQVQGPIQVWDLPVRLVHWLMVFCFAGAYLTAEMDAWRLVHVTLGYTMAALVCFLCGEDDGRARQPYQRQGSALVGTGKLCRGLCAQIA